MIKTYVNKRYILLPVDNDAQVSKIEFYEGEGDEKKLLLDLDCKLAVNKTDFIACYDARELLGKNAYIECLDGVEIGQSEQKVLPEKDEYRPFAHFKPSVGWNNDPNGMIRYGGEYHAFYQLNPCGRDWGNMHWGHAVGSDGITWEERDVALFPDEDGTMFSGSAIEDENNVSGLKTGIRNPVLLFYTAAGGTNKLSKNKPFTQRIACSTDGGKTFVKLGGKPIIDCIAEGNRDPKVVRAEELGKFLLALYLSGNDYALFTSDNLLDWSMLQKITIAGESECPDIYAFKRGDKTYRALIGASDKYIIGEFSGGKFVSLTAVKRLSYSEKTGSGVPCSYAAQSFSGTDDRVLRMPWNNIGSPSAVGSCELGLMQEITLTGEGEDMRLNVSPAKETVEAFGAEFVKSVPPQEKVCVPLESNAYLIKIECDCDDFELNVFGLHIDADAEKGALRVGKTEIPLCKGEKTDVTVIIDRVSTEVYVGGVFATIAHVCDYSAPELNYSAKCETYSLTVGALKNIRSRARKMSDRNIRA